MNTTIPISRGLELVRQHVERIGGTEREKLNALFHLSAGVTSGRMTAIRDYHEPSIEYVIDQVDATHEEGAIVSEYRRRLLDLIDDPNCPTPLGDQTNNQ